MAKTSLIFEPLDATFGARVCDLKLADMEDQQFHELYDAWLEYGLLIFPEQFLDHQQQISFAKRFGELEFDLAALSNVKDDGSLRPNDGTDDMMKVIVGNMGWHHDSTYMPVQAKGAVFTAEVVPDSGGATGFADMRAAYDALDVDMQKKIESLRSHHSLYHSQAKIGHEGTKGSHSKNFGTEEGYNGYGFHDGPVSIRPLVKTHPETGRKNLLVGRHAYDIIGMDSDESSSLLQELADFACQAPRVYHHQWQKGDAVVWDNRCLMHQATPWPMEQARVMWHSRIAGEKISEAALLE